MNLTEEQLRVKERFPHGAKRFYDPDRAGEWRPITEADHDEQGRVRLTRKWGVRRLDDLLGDPTFCAEYGAGEKPQ